MTSVPSERDETLLNFATERQAEYLEAFWANGSFSAAARVKGVDRKAVSRAFYAVEKKAARQGYSPKHDMRRTVPDGFRVKGVSTYYNKEGNPAGQWVKSQVDAQRQLEMMQEAIAALCEDIRPVPTITEPSVSLDHLLSLYPVGDHHIGMLAWHEETGEDYNTSRSETLLMGAMDYLIDAAPASGHGVVVLCGDMMHYDGYESVTPQSKHQLDADSRYPRMVRAAMKTARYAVSRALEKHSKVSVVVSSGNHDPSSMAFLREAMSCLYENNPRVFVDRTPSPFHYIEHGKCLLGFHHGDKVKMQDLPLLMATDRAEAWGRTLHRHIFTGHVHHDSVKDMVGAKVESLRILPPVDAYAHSHGYRSGRDMKRIEFHATYGEVNRQSVTPEMLDSEQGK
jgi:hypothetical protein